MSNYASAFLTRIFAQQQTSGSWPANFGVVNNTSGTWDSTGVKFIPATENGVRLTPNLPKTPNPLLTGTRSTRPGILGRKSASWELNNLQVIPNGGAGVVPDSDYLWQNIFGQAATIVASTSATYSYLDSGFLPFTLFAFYHSIPTLIQRLVWGCFVESFEFIFNGNIFVANVRGGGGYRLDSTSFSQEDTTAKAGLTAYPLEPGSAVQNGTIIPGFYATASFDSQSIEMKVSALTVQGSTGFVFLGDQLSSAYPVAVVGGPRLVNINMSFVDDDTSQLADLKNKAKSNTPIDATITLGQVAGAKVQMVFKSIQLVCEDYSDSPSGIVTGTFPSSSSHASAVGSIDDYSLIFL